MKSKKLIIAPIIFALALIMFASCGSGGGSSEEKKEEKTGENIAGSSLYITRKATMEEVDKYFTKPMLALEKTVTFPDGEPLVYRYLSEEPGETVVVETKEIYDRQVYKDLFKGIFYNSENGTGQIVNDDGKALVCEYMTRVYKGQRGDTTEVAFMEFPERFPDVPFTKILFVKDGAYNETDFVNNGYKEMNKKLDEFKEIAAKEYGAAMMNKDELAISVDSKQRNKLFGELIELLDAKEKPGASGTYSVYNTIGINTDIAVGEISGAGKMYKIYLDRGTPSYKYIRFLDPATYALYKRNSMMGFQEIKAE